MEWIGLVWFDLVEIVIDDIFVNYKNAPQPSYLISILIKHIKVYVFSYTLVYVSMSNQVNVYRGFRY